MGNRLLGRYRLRPDARRVWGVLVRLSAFFLLWGLLAGILLAGPHA